MSSKKPHFPKVLVVDIETSPMVAYTWGLFDQNIPLNQVVEDWYILSYSAKFLGEKKIYYSDQRNEKDISNDKRLAKELHALLDASDIVVGQNLDKFDVKKINARMIAHGLMPPSSYKTIDTLKMAKSKFGFSSYKLEHLSSILNKKHKKSKHKKYSGFELWRECLSGNKEAWREMEAYNKKDILATEELYKKLAPWVTNHIDFNLYHDTTDWVCRCGSKELVNNGFSYLSSGKYQRYKCKECGAEARSKKNLLTKEKRASLRK